MILSCILFMVEGLGIYIYIYIYIYIWILPEFNSVFFLLDQLPYQALRASLPYYLSIAGRRIVGFIPFPKVLVLSEMQKASSSIWTLVALSISFYGNDYTATAYICISWPTVVKANPKAPFSIATTLKHRGGCYFFPWMLHFTLDSYLMIQSVR